MWFDRDICWSKSKAGEDTRTQNTAVNRVTQLRIFCVEKHEREKVDRTPSPPFWHQLWNCHRHTQTIIFEAKNKTSSKRISFPRYCVRTTTTNSTQYVWTDTHCKAPFSSIYFSNQSFFRPYLQSCVRIFIFSRIGVCTARDCFVSPSRERKKPAWARTSVGAVSFFLFSQIFLSPDKLHCMTVCSQNIRLSPAR